MEDNLKPTLTLTPPPTTPLRDTIKVAYEAEDKGSGFDRVELALDFDFILGSKGSAGSDDDLNGGRCREVAGGGFGSMVPCELKTGKREISVDTTKISDGHHTLTPIFVDAAGNLVIGATFPITVDNSLINTQRPALSGTAKVGEKLSAANGTWKGFSVVFTHQWLRCPPGIADNSEAGCTEIGGATGAQYTATAADLGKRLVAKVIATSPRGADTALSAPSDPVAEKPGGGGGNPPQTKLSKHPRKKTAMRKVKLSFSADQPGSHFQCKLDKAPFKACRSPYKHKVKRGRHSFQVRAVNSAGAADPTPAKFSWRVS
jgi:hypothetical protein